MAEQMTSPEVPAQEAPVQAVPAQTAPVQVVPTPSHAPRKGSPLLVFLTVLLVLVGIADAILWGIVGYYFLKNHQSGSGEPVQSAVFGGEADSGGAADSDTEKRDALLAYVQEMGEIYKLGFEVSKGYDSVIGENYTDNATVYAEVTEHAIPLCQQVKERAEAVVPSDPEISEAHAIYLDNIATYLNALNMVASAIDNQDTSQFDEANNLFSETVAQGTSYNQTMEKLTSEWNVPWSS